MAGYALSHLTFRGSKATFLLILAAMMIPFQVITVPFVKTLNDMSLLNTNPGLIIAYVSQFLPFTIYFMTSYFARIPKEMTEAARVDGNNIWGVFGRIMLPLGFDTPLRGTQPAELPLPPGQLLVLRVLDQPVGHERTRGVDPVVRLVLHLIQGVLHELAAQSGVPA